MRNEVYCTLKFHSDDDCFQLLCFDEAGSAYLHVRTDHGCILWEQ